MMITMSLIIVSSRLVRLMVVFFLLVAVRLSLVPTVAFMLVRSGWLVTVSAHIVTIRRLVVVFHLLMSIRLVAMALVFNTMLILRVGQGNSQDRNENQSNLNQI